MSATPDHRTPRDEPQRALTPRFLAPPAATAQTPEPDPATSPPLGTATAAPEGPGQQPTPRLLARARARLLGNETDADQPTRTGTSSPVYDDEDELDRDRPRTKIDTAAATKLVVGLILVVGTTTAAVIKWQAKRKLRTPTKRQAKDIAAPVARILMRHANIASLAPDLGDVLEAAAATGEYLGDGPLTTHLDHADPGIPPDLQEATE